MNQIFETAQLVGSMSVLLISRRQTPGVETESAAFSRNTSLANDEVTESTGSTVPVPAPPVPTCSSPVSPIRELPELKDVMVQVGHNGLQSDGDFGDG